ncbi:hypothetical protein ACFLX5_04390 [Chloroflexota bacterium]
MNRIPITIVGLFSLCALVGCVSTSTESDTPTQAPSAKTHSETASDTNIDRPSAAPLDNNAGSQAHGPRSTVELLEEEAEDQEENTDEISYSECSIETLFTASPLDIDNISTIVSLGNMNPPSHVFPTDHIYFYISRVEGSDRPDTVPLYAPGDLTVNTITASEHFNAGFADYSINLQPCEHVIIILGHVSSLSAAIFGDTLSFENWTLENEYSTGGETYRRWREDCNIEVKAGQLLGTAGGNPGQWALDVGVYDLRNTQNDVANPQRWSNSLYLHAVDPLVCFVDGTLLNRLLLLVNRELAEGDNLPYGSVLQDVPGTAQGCWFFSGISNTYPEDPHLALVHSNIYPNRAVFSVGTSIPNLDSATYEFLPKDSGLLNNYFNEITPDGQIHGFQVDRFDGVIILEMVDDDTIWIEALEYPHLDPSGWAFSDNKAIFER